MTRRALSSEVPKVPMEPCPRCGVPVRAEGFRKTRDGTRMAIFRCWLCPETWEEEA